MNHLFASHSLKHYRNAIDDGTISSRALIEDCLAAAKEPSGEGRAVFIELFESTARAAAEAADYLPLAADLPLRGVPISIKDLFDMEGQVTRAGSVVLNDAAPAVRDAEVIGRLKDAGAVLIGRTNMTEFAYSGLGINPHYGTPCTPYERKERRIPGGSSSGAAVSVTDGMATAAIGSDTAGSVRIPAALCGLTGFKPTARRVSRDGILPLSTTLDSVGPIAPTVACCALLDEVMSGETHQLDSIDLRGLKLGVVEGFVLDGLEPPVAASFDRAVQALSDAGAILSKLRFTGLEEIPQLLVSGGFSGYEAWHWHRDLMERRGGEYDPRVLARIMRGSKISEQDYAQLKRERSRLMEEAEEMFTKVDAWLMPTVPRIAPRIADVAASDEAYFEANAAMLRNTGVINFLDACAITLPCHRWGEAPVGVMLSARGGDDSRLLAVAKRVEDALCVQGCAIHGRELVGKE